MVSTMVSRAIGFWMEITQEQLSVINECRESIKYVDEEASTNLNGNTLKRPLLLSPFVQYLNYGTG